MRKTLAIALTAISLIFILAACTQNDKPKDMLTDEEIVQAMTPFLDEADLQDPANYPTFGEFTMANLGLGDDKIKSMTLYMGAPKQNTTFFLMITPANESDKEDILKKVEEKMEAQVATANMGYMTGSTEYQISDKAGRIFAVMNKDAQNYAKMCDYIATLE